MHFTKRELAATKPVLQLYSSLPPPPRLTYSDKACPPHFTLTCGENACPPSLPQPAVTKPVPPFYPNLQ